MRFCDEIEEFVPSGSMWDWWNHRVHEKCLSMYCLWSNSLFHSVWVLNQHNGRKLFMECYCAFLPSPTMVWILICIP